MAEQSKADAKAAEARRAERERLDRDTDRRLAALSRSARNQKRGKR